MIQHNIKELFGKSFYNNMQNTTYIAVYICDKCNYKCSYCYNCQKRSNNELNLDILYQFLIVFHHRTQKNIRLELIGGETTLHSNLLNFLDKINSLEFILSIEIFTNMHKEIAYFLNIIQKNNKSIIEATWHSTIDDKFNISFLRKIESISQQMKKNFYISVMFEPCNIEQSLFAFNKIQKIFGIKTNIKMSLCVDKNEMPSSLYSHEDLKNFYIAIEENRKNILEYRTVFEDGRYEDISFNDIQGTKNNNFKYWLCNVGVDYLYIDVFGDCFKCTQDCLTSKSSLFNIYDIKSIVFPKKATICKYNCCPCNWEIRKTKIFKNYDT